MTIFEIAVIFALFVYVYAMLVAVKRPSQVKSEAKKHEAKKHKKKVKKKQKKKKKEEEFKEPNELLEALKNLFGF